MFCFNHLAFGGADPEPELVGAEGDWGVPGAALAFKGNPDFS